MAKPLKALRKRLGLSVEDLAERTGVTSTQVSKWERGWEELPAAVAIDLAVHYGVSAADVTGEEISVEQWRQSPYAVTDVEPLYGTLRLTFFDGVITEYPVSQKARESILSQLSERSFLGCDDKAGTEPWLYFWSMDDRIGFARMSCVHEIALLSDDERAAPDHFHPEIYRLAGRFDLDEEPEPASIGPEWQTAYNRLVQVLGSEEVAHQRATHARLVFKDGRELFADCSTPDSAAPYFTLDLSNSEIPRNAFLQIKDVSDYQEAYFVNMDALRLITLPAEAYHRATAPEESDGVTNNIGDQDQDMEGDA